MPTSTTSARAAQSSRNAEQPGPAPGAAESLATGGALIACLLSRLPHHLVAGLGVRGWVPALVVVVAAVSGARALLRAPFTVARTLDGTSRPRGALRRWAGSELKLAVVSTIVGAAMTVPLYALLRATPSWWLFAWFMFAAVTIGSQVAMPIVLRAQVGPLTPAPPALAERVQAVAARAGVDVGAGVLLAGKPASRGGNAYVAGLSRTRRVVLEQAVTAWPPELIDQVVAHELGHWRLGHNARRLPLTLGCQLATLAVAAVVLSYTPLLHLGGVADAGDPRSYPLLVVLGAVLVLPLRCLLAWRDRDQERAADRFALDLLDRPSDFRAMLERAAGGSEAPSRLPWWRRLTASHPPIDERTAACHVELPPVPARLQPTGA